MLVGLVAWKSLGTPSLMSYWPILTEKLILTEEILTWTKTHTHHGLTLIIKVH